MLIDLKTLNHAPQVANLILLPLCDPVQSALDHRFDVRPVRLLHLHYHIVDRFQLRIWQVLHLLLRD